MGELTREAKAKIKNWMAWTGAMVFVAVCSSACYSADEPTRKGMEKLVPVADTKPLNDNVKMGLTRPAEHQSPNGAWDKGEESAQMAGVAALKDTPDKSVADTPNKPLTKIQRNQPAGGSVFSAGPAGTCADTLPRFGAKNQSVPLVFYKLSRCVFR
jgi:hypothetical protein